MPVIKLPFKIETRGKTSVGYPYINWWFQGIRYEGLLDTGADNIVAGIDFLQVLEQNGVLKIEEIYDKKKYLDSVGIGGGMCLSNPVPIEIELKTALDSHFLDIMVSCCLPDNKKNFNEYLTCQSEMPFLEQQLNATRDQRLIKKNTDKINYVRKLKAKYNPPFLFGKPFMSKFKYITFVINEEKANNGSYFEFEMRPEFLKQKTNSVASKQ